MDKPEAGYVDRRVAEDRVSRLKALGNAVVPAQIYPIFKAIMEVEEALFLPPDSKGA